MSKTIEPNLSFIISPKAKELIAKSPTPSITIAAVEINQCCIPLAAPPEVRRGIPAKPERFLLVESEGIFIYFDRQLPRKPQLTIDVHGFGPLKGLHITDWEIRY